MFARVEVTLRPEFSDPLAQELLRRVELVHPAIRKRIRWARCLNIHWLDLPTLREETISSISEVYWDPVLQWLFTGNLIPSAAGKQGGVPDLMERAPNRPGVFWAIEKRFRTGVSDSLAQTSLEALEMSLGRRLEEARASSGSLLLLEGQEITEEDLAQVARDVFCNEILETWTLVPEAELKKNDRFHQERVKRDLTRAVSRVQEKPTSYDLKSLPNSELEALSARNYWGLSAAELKALADEVLRPEIAEARAGRGLPQGTWTGVELELLAQNWKVQRGQACFHAAIDYADASPQSAIPAVISDLFNETVESTTAQLQKPWLLSLLDEPAGVVAFDDDDALCVSVSTVHSALLLEPAGTVATALNSTHRDVLALGRGAKPILNTDVLCFAPLERSSTAQTLPMHPRRILDGMRRGLQQSVNQSGVPLVNGAMSVDERYGQQPLAFLGTAGLIPRMVAGRPAHLREVKAGDLIWLAGGGTGKDGIPSVGQSVSVQLADPITQKRLADFLIEARDMGLYSALSNVSEGGLARAVTELAQISGGARVDVSCVKLKSPGMRPNEILASQSQERIVIAAPRDRADLLVALAQRRGVELSTVGEFDASGSLEVFSAQQCLGVMRLELLNDLPRPQYQASGFSRPDALDRSEKGFAEAAPTLLAELLGRPSISSKEWLIQQVDHEVQGASVIKPIQAVASGTVEAASSPNDGAVLLPKLHESPAQSHLGLAVASGLNSRLADFDPFLMAQSAVDEAVRNLLCVGAEFGHDDAVLGLVENVVSADPATDPQLCSQWVRACYGVREAALGLGTPIISAHQTLASVSPTVLMTAVGRVSDIRKARSSDFKLVGDWIYLLGGRQFGLRGSEFEQVLRDRNEGLPVNAARVGEPDWDLARRTYSWLGGSSGKEAHRIKSVHDVSEGGLATAVAEACFARGLGAQIQVPNSEEPWEFTFGEGFHSLLVSCTEADASVLEGEWTACNVPFVRLGSVVSGEHLEFTENSGRRWRASVRSLRASWKKAGYWE